MKKLNNIKSLTTPIHHNNTIEITVEAPKNIVKKIEKPVIKEVNQTQNYTIRYCVVDSNKIINMCGPEYIYSPISWNDYDQLELRKSMAEKYVKEFNNICGFYDKLEKNILEEGFKNPVLLTCGTPKFRNINEIPPYLREDNMLICELLGGSRIYIAQKHDMLLPAIICDFTNEYKWSKQLKTLDDIKKCFTDIPENIIINESGLRISPSKHIDNITHEQMISYRKEVFKRIKNG